MLNDRELEQATAQLQDFRVQSDSHQKTQFKLIEKYNTLIEDYKRLKSDYEEERDARERYKQMARGQERNPFVLVLIDGDGYVFDDDLISASSDGGMRAGRLLNDAVKASLLSRNLDHCRIVVRMYANLSSLSKTLSKNKLCGAEKRSLSPFFSGFNHSNELFDFVDAGELKESADFKIRGIFRQSVENAQCKHIFFAACHDVAYMSELTPYSSKRDHITLIRTRAFHPEFSRLGLRTEEFPSIFRAAPLLNSDTLPATKKGPTTPTTSQPSSTPSVDLSSVCSFYQRGLCKYGKTCKFLHIKTGTNGYSASIPNLSEIKDWRKDASPNNISGSSFHNSMDSEEVAQAQVDFLTLLPREDDIPENKIPINEHEQRLDSYLPTPTNEDRAHFNARVSRQKLCNNLHLNGSCSHGPACQYDHSEITEGMRICLKQIAHNNPCPRRDHCRSVTCLYGHICQKPDCKYRGGKAYCKFPHQVHFVDLNVYEYVSGSVKEAAPFENTHTNGDDHEDDHEDDKHDLNFLEDGRVSSSLSASNDVSSPLLLSDRALSPLPFDAPPTNSNDTMAEMQEELSSDTAYDTPQVTSDTANWWQQ